MRAWLCIALLTAGGAMAAPDPDPWLGPDKALHGSVSALLAGVGYTGAAFFTDGVRVRLAVGGAFALTLGAAKELADLAGLGDPSWRDFTWDVIGTALGLVASFLLDHFVVTPLLLHH